MARTPCGTAPGPVRAARQATRTLADARARRMAPAYRGLTRRRRAGTHRRASHIRKPLVCRTVLPRRRVSSAAGGGSAAWAMAGGGSRSATIRGRARSVTPRSPMPPDAAAAHRASMPRLAHATFASTGSRRALGWATGGVRRATRFSRRVGSRRGSVGELVVGGSGTSRRRTTAVTAPTGPDIRQRRYTSRALTADHGASLGARMCAYVSFVSRVRHHDARGPGRRPPFGARCGQRPCLGGPAKRPGAPPPMRDAPITEPSRTSSRRSPNRCGDPTYAR